MMMKKRGNRFYSVEALPFFRTQADLRQTTIETKLNASLRVCARSLIETTLLALVRLHPVAFNHWSTSLHIWVVPSQSPNEVNPLLNYTFIIIKIIQREGRCFVKVPSFLEQRQMNNFSFLSIIRKQKKVIVWTMCSFQFKSLKTRVVHEPYIKTWITTCSLGCVWINV